MRNFSIVFLLFVCVGLFAQTKAVDKKVESTPAAAPSFVMAKSKAVMTFESMTLDYGKVEQNGDPIRLIKFTNTGTEPLIVESATSTCGCTVPSPPKDPIAPGQSASMEVRYNTGNVGTISKAVRIKTNEGVEHVIQLTGEVIKKEDKTVPQAQPNIIKGN